LPNDGKSAFPNSKKAKDERLVILFVDDSAFYLLPLLAHTATADRLGSLWSATDTY
jgi:hypothetical protein